MHHRLNLLILLSVFAIGGCQLKDTEPATAAADVKDAGPSGARVSRFGQYQGYLEQRFDEWALQSR